MPQSRRSQQSREETFVRILNAFTRVQLARRSAPRRDAAVHTRVDRLAHLKGTLLPVQHLSPVYGLGLCLGDGRRSGGTKVATGSLMQEVHGLGSWVKIASVGPVKCV